LKKKILLEKIEKVCHEQLAMQNLKEWACFSFLQMILELIADQ